ncbi:MAG: amidohydrolase family protein [Candidatus Lokiarchaeota archaeon]|nr:amidohydrolase family protein [Candidatus Lokiarchaeota archaeon]
MIIANITLPDGSKVARKILVIDAHSHLGSDIDGVNNMNPMAAGGTYNFYINTESKIKQEKSDLMSYEVSLNGKSHKFEFEFAPLPFIYNLFKYFKKIGDSSYANDFDKMNGGWLIDHGVVFPFQDKFRDNKPEAQYRASNLNIARFTTHFPNSVRLIGYCRVNPRQPQASDEVNHSIQELGLRGLKLHPRSDGWTDEIASNFAVNVLITAAKNSIPVIFDTRGAQSILDIHQLVKRTRNQLKKSASNLISHLKVIVAHCAMGYIGNNDVYRVLTDPNIWGEISMLHGKGTIDFFITFMNWYKDNFPNHSKRWSEKIIFGSDFPYFTPIHAKDNIWFLISKQFFENGGTLTDTENILGLNLLKLLPSYSKNNKLKRSEYTGHSHVYLSGTSNTELYKNASKLTAELIRKKRLDINQINFMFNQGFYNISNNLLIKGTLNTKKKTRILVHDFIKDNLMLYTTLDPDIKWNYMGFRYFNPKDQALFIKAYKMNIERDFSSQYRTFNENLL